MSRRNSTNNRFTLFKPRTRETNFLLSVLMTTIRMLFVLVLLIGVSGTGLVVGIARAYVDTAPVLDLTLFDQQSQTSFIYDRDGNLITDFKGTENRIYASIDEMPEMLQNAFIAIEDSRFREHNGVDVKRIIGAFVYNVTGSGTTQGGSTITQQLIKQTILTTEQTYKRKIQEAYLALQLETVYTKDQILEEYLNVIYLGNSSYGVKVAAQDYFGKDLSELTIRECAMLAGLNKNPYGYNPRLNYYSRDKADVTDKRTNDVLAAMYNAGFITEDQYNAALVEKVNVLETSPLASKMYDNAFYVEYAIYDVTTHMLRMYNLEDNSTNRNKMENQLRTGGYHIYTAMDAELQTLAEQTIHDWDGYPSTRNSADAVYRTSNGDGTYTEIIQPQAAAVVIDYHTSEIVAIVGGRDTPTTRKQFNRAYMGLMPVGSSIKPLSVYGPAWDLGSSPGAPVMNMPIRISGWNSERGYPQNYGGGGYTGPESMRTAMTKSHNTSTAQALYTYVGINNSVYYLKQLGVDESHINADGAGLTLGTSGITPVEMAAAFGAIGNKGEYVSPVAFTRVLNSDGSVFLEPSTYQVRQQAFKPSTAWLLVDVLKACASSSGTGSRAEFSDITVAGKTGTNSDYKGVFFAGLTPYYSGAVWIGHDGYKALKSDSTGGKYAAPLWGELMEVLHDAAGYTEDRAIIEDSPESLGLVRVATCGVSGLLATDACYHDVDGYEVQNDYWLDGTQPTQECNMHQSVTLCTETKRRPTEYCPSVATYSRVYIPEGHPLRQADKDVVDDYFSGVTANADLSSIGYCTKHTSDWYYSQWYEPEPEPDYGGDTGEGGDQGNQGDDGDYEEDGDEPDGDSEEAVG